MKGSSSNLMKRSAKRRRSKIEIKETKRPEQLEQELITQKLAEFDKMKSDLANMSQ